MAEPAEWPEVVAVIPARNEADVIARTLGSVAAQDYPGRFRVLLVDDNSDDGTGEIARALASHADNGDCRQAARAGLDRQALGAVAGYRRRGQPALPVADRCRYRTRSRYLAPPGRHRPWGPPPAGVVHGPPALRELGRAGADPCLRLVLHDALPVQLDQPARSPVSGAAGGCVLVERAALEDAGGIAAIRGALIDDCALGTLIKRQGPIWVGLTHRSRSIRPYRALAEIEAMIARSAYAQLRYSPLMLAATVLGLALLFVVPLGLAVFARGLAQGLAIATLALMVLAYQPIMRFYRRSPLWGLALPLVGLFYGWCTLASAWQHRRGRGGMWKGRAQALKRLETPGR